LFPVVASIDEFLQRRLKDLEQKHAQEKADLQKKIKLLKSKVNRGN